MMQIVHVTYFFDSRNLAAEEHIQQHYTITGWAEALQRRGHAVKVISRFHKNDYLRVNHVDYIFIRDRYGSRIRAWQLPWKFLRQVSRVNADVIHLHHLSLSWQTFMLRLMLPRKTAIVVQHHGGRLPGKLKRFFFNILNSAADGFFFTSLEQGQEWFMKKMPHKKILPVMEGATFFNFSGRDTSMKTDNEEKVKAAKKTGMNGDPVFLWVGRLDENKDPLTVLEGCRVLFRKLPQACLYMIYSDSSLEEEVQKKISSDPVLNSRVHLLGKIIHEEIRDYYLSAGYFVLGSHYEGSGYALSEALRCGCIPVVTDIPSFRMMTSGGSLGALWKPGDPGSLTEAVSKAMCKSRKETAEKCMEFYSHHLSFDAIAKKAEEHYSRLSQKRRT